MIRLMTKQITSAHTDLDDHSQEHRTDKARQGALQLMSISVGSRSGRDESGQFAQLPLNDFASAVCETLVEAFIF